MQTLVLGTGQVVNVDRIFASAQPTMPKIAMMNGQFTYMNGNLLDNLQHAESLPEPHRSRAIDQIRANTPKASELDPMKVKQETGGYKCIPCDKEFRNPQALKMHMRSHK